MPHERHTAAKRHVHPATPRASCQPKHRQQAVTSNPARPVQNDEYAAFTRRILRAYAQRVAAGDIDAITRLAALADEVDTAIRQAIIGLRGYGPASRSILAVTSTSGRPCSKRPGSARHVCTTRVTQQLQLCCSSASRSEP
jgi:hypothetical protein